jgi:hypothetical protein
VLHLVRGPSGNTPAQLEDRGPICARVSIWKRMSDLLRVPQLSPVPATTAAGITGLETTSEVEEVLAFGSLPCQLLTRAPSPLHHRGPR